MRLVLHVAVAGGDGRSEIADGHRLFLNERARRGDPPGRRVGRRRAGRADGADRQAQSGAERRDRARRRWRAKAGARRRQGGQKWRATRAAARRAVHAEGCARDGRDAHHRRVSAVCRLCARRRQRGGGAAQGGGRDPGRQDQHGDAARRLPDRQSAVRQDQQSVGRRAHAGRLERRRGSSTCGRDDAVRDRHRHAEARSACPRISAACSG